MKSLSAAARTSLSARSRAADLSRLRAAALDALRTACPREKAAMARALLAVEGGANPVDPFVAPCGMSVDPAGPTDASSSDAPIDPIDSREAGDAGEGREGCEVRASGRMSVGAVRPGLPDSPGRPARPALVDPRALARRNVTTIEGRCVMLHAIAHIEFNAINLALDAVARFDGMPAAFYRDWVRVAAEEGYHFTLLADHLGSLGSEYGAFPAHDGLWEMALRTKDDVLARMALVPRTLEARGLDAAPPIRQKFSAAGDTVAAGILDIILRDEIGHVAIGNRWYRWLCARAGHDPLAHYAILARDYRAPRLRGPFNLAARKAAGFDDAELAALQAAAG